MFPSFFATITNELCDKTFFMTMYFATKCNSTKVFTSCTLALWVMTVLSAVVGRYMGQVLPIEKISTFLYAIFMIVTLLDLREQNKEENVVSDVITFKSMFILTALAEMGDKSQFSTITMAGCGDYHKVMIGSMLGHTACVFVAIRFGKFFIGKERVIASFNLLLTCYLMCKSLLIN